ncbi:hypothetical protein C8Q73DRAFT_126256 [Cubamyces lactineus]|nr:hypothetical protein C8Q73DRAFT_126256 [Cubamyces lactineus]
MNLVHAAPTPSQHPLFTRTNAPRLPKVHFKLPLLKKSAPTVSVTNTNAARTNTSGILLSSSLPEVTPQSSIPFPSSPIPCPSPRKRALSEKELPAAQEIKITAQPGSRHVSHADIVRRRHKSCLAASYFHHNSHLARKTSASSENAEKPVVPPPAPAQAIPVHRPVARRESMSAGTPAGKDLRRARRLVADAQFLASMHSSIASRVRMRAPDADSRDDLIAQDALLVERIWHTLVDMGYKPVPLESAPAAPPASPPDSAREAAERAARKTAAAVASTPISSDRVQDVTLTPTGVLAVPQLVAVLTMRHRDRSTTRPRSAAKKRAEVPPLLRSPLSTTIFPSEPLSSSSSG